ncbi:MAG: hypothetical protein ACLTZB_05770 [Streptococcus salivarius]
MPQNNTTSTASSEVAVKLPQQLQESQAPTESATGQTREAVIQTELPARLQQQPQIPIVKPMLPVVNTIETNTAIGITKMLAVKT